MAIFTTSGNSKCAVDGHEYPPKPAGNSHRHEDEETSALWDRLRADLSNLGAAYGELPAHIRDYQEGPCETISCAGDERPTEAVMQGIIDQLMAGNLQCPQCALWVTGTLMDKHLAGSCAGHLRQLPIDPSVFQSAWDSILLAARKKREAAYAKAEQGERDFWEAQAERYWARKNRGFKIGDYEWKPASDRLAAALSKPLDHEPRLGWKPGDCE